MNKLLVICGSTATGKTKLALTLAKKFNGEVISADSRQAYKGLDIGTGKDLPKGRKIYGYDLVGPKEEFSVANYEKEVEKFLDEIYKKGRLPILTGGTGFYIDAVVYGIPTSIVPRNEKLRKNLENKSVNELFNKLKTLDIKRANNLNNSDKNNPARLIRAIEIASSGVKLERKRKRRRFDVLFVGLKTDKKDLAKRIEERVKKRVSQGVEKEIKNLLKSGVTWDMQSMNSMGYREWKDYFLELKTKGSVIDEWIADEKRYAKRQMVWFKRNKKIRWFDIANPFTSNVEELVEKWYKE